MGVTRRNFIKFAVGGVAGDEPAVVETGRDGALVDRGDRVRILDNFSSGSVCMVLASEFFSENDYVRDWDTFVTLAK